MVNDKQKFKILRSINNYGTRGTFHIQYTTDLTVSKLKKYDYVLLSHQHQPQELVKNKIYHIGSVFYKNFGEVEDKNKQVVLIDNGKLSFIPLKSPIPMVDIIDVKKLNKIDPKTKVRLIIKSFEDYKRNVNHLSKWKEKFHTFEYKLDFKQITEKKIEEVIKEKKEPESKSLKLLLNEELNKIEDEEVKGLLISQFEESK